MCHSYSGIYLFFLIGNSGGNGIGNTTTIFNVSSEFHTYEIEWDADTINFFVDGEMFHKFANDDSVSFNHDFFFILNVVMGGSFGGVIEYIWDLQNQPLR